MMPLLKGKGDKLNCDDFDNTADCSSSDTNLCSAKKHNVNSFDSDEVDEQYSSPALRSNINTAIFNVPIPSYNDKILQSLVPCSSCTLAHACVVSNIPTPSVIHPVSCDNLRKIYLAQKRCTAGKEKNLRLVNVRLKAKGAFHTYQPEVGNGVLDLVGAGVENNGGGCPFLVCRNCDYPVIRLQNAEWYGCNNSDTEKEDLYFITRNYYPDWSAIASSQPYRENNCNTNDSYALASVPGSAAYCCQCSWLTVSCPKAVIKGAEGLLTELYHCRNNNHLLDGKRYGSLPPWLCKGHHVKC